ncbi:hypothetical protein AMS68_007924 [Peltaster fructicola]|uniref:Homeobox domain-containing protein n=1 Tax=Peltaster fructicola TaxID=286661 RepID=A0A6H0Y5S9_9PEZI|nr:hypothetical protein AMS68_007924 [Peltaster fructicola]
MEYAHDFAFQQHHQQQLDFGVAPPQADLHQHQPRYHPGFDLPSSAMQEPTQGGYALPTTTQQKLSCDVKPRLTKEQHDVLEAHYQKQQKPNTSTKRGFAEALNVSLEKVNNWFQNRRAKSKQDAKKQQGPVGIFSVPQSSQISLGASESDTSPAYPAADYMQMMPDEDDMLTYEQPQPHAMANTQLMAATAEMNYLLPDMLPQELNRRTLTQEQFDAFAQQDMMLKSGDLAMLAANAESFNNYFDAAPMPQESELPFDFSGVQQHAISAPSSEWTDSRSSSVSLPQSFDQQNISTPLTQLSLSQWQPGQSVPVDFEQLNQEFQKAAQARQTPVDHSPIWPEAELVRRDSTTSLLAQSMGKVGLHTPQPQQQPFKSPTPMSSLAARRQRQRPAPLGLTSLRSQSYTGTAQTAASPGQMQPPSNTPPQLRRIKSSNVISGIAQGRVQKSVAPPQRSPLAWSFTDAMTSPRAVRHQSSQSASGLAPPTPMSPPDNTAELMKAQQQWQNAQHINSISETDVEHAFPPQTFASPPHTPMFYPHQQFLPPQIIPGGVVMENTPPQSAPASQQCFPQNVYGQSPQHVHQYQRPTMYQPQPMQQVYMPQQAHQVMMAEQEQLHMGPPFTVTTSGQAVEIPLQFAQNGLPIVDAQGQIALAMPSQLQFIQHKVPRSDSKQGFPAGSQTTFSVSPETMSIQVTAQVPKNTAQSSSDFFVHEYSPPQDIKRDMAARKGVDSGPKNYTFANQTPEHFEKGKKSEKSSTSSSPDSAGSAST